MYSLVLFSQEILPSTTSVWLQLSGLLSVFTLLRGNLCSVKGHLALLSCLRPGVRASVQPVILSQLTRRPVSMIWDDQFRVVALTVWSMAHGRTVPCTAHDPWEYSILYGPWPMGELSPVQSMTHGDAMPCSDDWVLGVRATTLNWSSRYTETGRRDNQHKNHWLHTGTHTRAKAR